jgi:hypothetical protein
MMAYAFKYKTFNLNFWVYYVNFIWNKIHYFLF